MTTIPSHYHKYSFFSTSNKIPFQAYSSPFTGPTISSCPRKKYATEDPYRSRWAQAQLTQQIKDRMWMDLQEMQTNPYYGTVHQNSCLMKKYCPKNPFDRKNLLGINQNEDKNLTMSLMDPHWTQKQKKSSFYANPNVLNYSSTLNQYRQLRNKMPKYQDRILSTDSLFEQPSRKLTFGEEGFKLAKQGREGKTIDRIGSQDSLSSPFADSPKFQTRQGLKKMVKRMSSSHEYSDKDSFSGYPKSIQFRGIMFQAMPLY